jgi:multidrug resistance efflux pump
MESVDLQQQLDEIGDQLKLAQAELKAHLAQVVWESQLRGDRTQKALAEYYESWGTLLEERSKLEMAIMERERLEATRQQNPRAVSKRQLDAAEFAERGQRSKVNMLDEALDKLKKRTELYEEKDLESNARISPQILRIETLQSALTRVRQRVSQGQIRAPVNGRVLKLLRLTGEFGDPTHPVMEVVEEGSVEVVLFLSQRRAIALARGKDVRVRVDPFHQPIPCRVERRGSRLETPPSNIERYYAKNERLIPVYLQARWPFGEPSACLGSEVKLAWHALSATRDNLDTTK